MSLYAALKAAGVKIDNHASDLYFESTATAHEVLKAFPKQHTSPFMNQIDHRVWIEAPFAYDPFWEARQRS